MSIIITTLNPVNSHYDGPRKHIERCLGFEKEWYQEQQYGKKRNTYWYTSHISKDGYFLSGWIPRLKKYCEDRGELVEVIQRYNSVQIEQEPYLEGIKFREDQLRLINMAITRQRGVLKAPTGAGKTVVALGIMSCFPSHNILFISHSLSLLKQTIAELKRFGFTDVGEVGGGKKEIDKRIIVATRQTYEKLESPPSPDILIVDECHHISKIEDSSYSKILGNILAPIRIGLTATPPIDEEAELAMEGYLGPIIASVSTEEGIEKGFLAKPRIKILKSPFSQTIKETRNYPDVYDLGIVKYRPRNRMIATEVQRLVQEGKTVLIIVNKIEHGNILQEMISCLDIKTNFVHGEVDTSTREMLRNLLNEKIIDCAIATVVWKEGINIPSLDVIINAAGGKSEIATLQTLGRGLRTTESKKEVLLIDIFDPSHHYLIGHFGERIGLYSELGWL